MLRVFFLATLLVSLFFSIQGCKDASGKPSIRELEGRITALSDENSSLKERIQGLESEIEGYSLEISNLRAERNALEKERDVLKSRLNSRGRR